ncbi:benzoate-CoA ligase family protein [Nocardiopsis exhalans]|uniref:Benzoate-CoA ligase family protein n=1 Tax=Nocardiopsis exhalans TaxID=163604 RepID=A0ABY5D5S7_9ACTN|nr:benzoate-CoA ligase family protein [Nocardiopsis exhalans]USY18594.1 benzoate-CoA ligase family protein [Nocardiopsis exhalans]
MSNPDPNRNPNPADRPSLPEHALPAVPLSPTAHEDTFTREHLPPAEEWPLIRPLDHPDRLNCAKELLDGTIARCGADRRCVVGEHETLTYGRLRDRVDRIARVLVDECGLRPGERVLLRGPNSPWLAACWLAVIKAGGVVVTVLPVLRAGELSTIVRSARVTHALCDARFLDDLTAAADQLGDRAPSVLVYGGGADSDLTARVDAHPPDFTAVPTAADDACMIAYTSGTTGAPKGCVHFHRDVLAIADTYSAQVLKPTPDDLFVGSPPFAFTFGLGGLLIFPMRAGAATVLLERPRPEAILDAVSEHGASVVFTAPTAYRSMLTQLEGRDLSSLRRCVSAGEHLPAATWQAWYDATGVRLLDGIGATEMLHIFVSASDEHMRPGSTGRPVPGFEAVILDDEGEPVPDGEPGHLAVRGPVGCRYLSDERQREYVRHGWNHTGDTYVRDEDGYFWYRARSDDMIVSAGYNIAPAEVEEALLTSPDVEEAAVVAAQDPDRGLVVRAYVVPRRGLTADTALADRLKDHVRSRIAPYKTPRSVVFLPSLPRTATGKLQRFRLREST